MRPSRRLLGLLLGRRLPRVSGTLRLSGPREPVLIRRDRYGIAHVQASGDADAAFAVGFCQGQDRAFQLEILLRLARGTLAGLVGTQALPIDRLVRRIGFSRGTAEQLKASHPSLAVDLDAFARGVSAGARLGAGAPAHEFALLRARPTPWSAGDVLAVNRLIAFLIPSNWDAELARLKILVEDGPEALLAIEGQAGRPLPPSAAATRRSARRSTRSRRASSGSAPPSGSAAPRTGGRSPGRERRAAGRCSRTTPISPRRSRRTGTSSISRRRTGGSPGRATPGHLPFSSASTATGPGASPPACSDTTDLFVERLEDAVVERRVEHIAVRRGSPVMEEVLVTANGPIVSPALDGVPYALSLRASWQEPRPLAGFLRSFRARSFAEFRSAFEQWPAVPLNLVWADRSGTIGWQLAGEVPRRPDGHGLLPAPGWESPAPWQEHVAFDEMPFVENPPGGVVVTANNQPEGNGAGPFLGDDWLDGYRAQRIHELLQARDDWDVEGSLRLQLDVAPLPWLEIRERVLAAPVSGASEEVRDLLAAWDGNLAPGSPAATAYVIFACRVVLRALREAAPRSAAWAAGKGFHVLAPSTLYGRRRMAQLPGLVEQLPPAELAAALADVAADLRRLGEDPAAWAWGRARPVVLRHPLGLRPPLGRVFDIGPLPIGGDASTVAQAPVTPIDPLGPPSVIPSLRAVIDVGNWEASRFSLAGGQSGNPLSSHYEDLLAPFLRGGGVPIAWSPESVRAATVDTLRLVPLRDAPPSEAA